MNKIDIGSDYLIHETKYTKIAIPKKPHITRQDGGHLVVFPKRKVKEAYELTDEELFDLAKTVTLLSKATKDVLQKYNVIIEKFNIQDNGNWAFLRNEEPSYHVHIYGRTKESIYQKFGEALYLPYNRDFPEFYDRNKPFNNDELQEIIDDFIKKYESSF